MSRHGIDKKLLCHTCSRSSANLKLFERQEKESRIDSWMILANSQINPDDLTTGSIAELIDQGYVGASECTRLKRKGGPMILSSGFFPNFEMESLEVLPYRHKFDAMFVETILYKKKSQELRMLSRSLSDSRSLLLNLNLNLNRCLLKSL